MSPGGASRWLKGRSKSLGVDKDQATAPTRAAPTEPPQEKQQRKAEAGERRPRTGVSDARSQARRGNAEHSSRADAKDG